MNLIDLHVHSNVSDGTLSPAQVVSLAAVKGLTAIALTDHDTMDGVAEAAAAAAGTSVEVVPGSELSCMYKGKEIHILGLFPDQTSEKLRSALQFQRESRDRRNSEMLRRLAEDGIVFTMEDLRGQNPHTIVTRAHFARVLMEKGYVTSVGQAFKKYLDHGQKYCPPKEAFAPEDAIALLREAGGFAAIAHPMTYKLGWKGTENLIGELAGMGLQGVEVYYSSHRQHESAHLRGICNYFHLLPTGGSDFHGANKPDIELGSGRGGLKVPAFLLEDIKKLLDR